jgi:SAM-dependent methyltransferase
MTALATKGPDRRALQRIAEEVIAAGPPGEEAYGRENIGRYVHTLAWLGADGTPPGGPLLDTGIYPGHLALALARLGCREIAGVGRFVPPAFRRWMAERSIAVADVDLEREPLPYAAASFDRLLATEILEHLASPALFLSECWRVLRPAGVLYLTTPNVVDLRGRVRAVRGRSPQSHLFGIGRPFRMNEWVHRREYDPHEVATLLDAVGFRVSRQHTWTPTRSEGGRGAGAWLAPLLNRLPHLGGTIFVTAIRPTGAGAAGQTDRARITPDCRYLEATPGASASVALRVSNFGTATWSAGSEPGAVRLGAHLLDPDGRVLDRDLARGPLPHGVGPGEEAVATLTVRAPAEAGVFLVEVDLVRDGEHWFGDDGSPTARVVLRVGR